MTEKAYIILLSTFIPFGPVRIALMKKYFGSYEKAWGASSKELLAIGLRSETVNNFLKHRRKISGKEYFQSLANKKISVVTINDENYPENLKGLGNAPCVLYIRGELKRSDINAIAIVGTRKMTSYGREVTEKFARELSDYGVTIVSGLAFGVDVAAHGSATEAGGRCIAVLASGIDMITPRSNHWLGERIINSGGAIISEFPPGTIPHKAFFPHRNRIISGLSKAVIVVEGMEKSGTLHTARHAAEQGKTVFAVPGQITSPMSGAPHFLIQNGAKIAFSVRDIVEELDLELKTDNAFVQELLPDDEFEAMIWKVLQNEEKHIDEIVRELKSDIAEVSTKLTIMVLKGSLRDLGDGMYKLLR